jgi:membrane carboxypeptidase/penicillin-binding protein PbpC
VTHRRTVIVWVGNADGQGSPSLIGQDAAAPLALQLIAMFDPEDDAWPVVPDAPQTIMPRSSSTRNELVMVHPTDGQQFVLTSDVSHDLQRMLLQAAHRDKTSELWWFVDGKPLEAGDDSKQFWWTPAAGLHEIRVVDSEGHSAMARVEVHKSIE